MAKGTFVKIDESLLSSPKIQKLLVSMGYEALGFYIALLTTIRNYRSTGYRIPLDDLDILASWQMKLTPDQQERFADFLEKAVELDILKRTDKYIWSERRMNDLLKQEEASRKMSEAGVKGMNNRWKLNGDN